MAFAQSKTATTTTLAVTSGGGTVTTVSNGSTVALIASVNAGTTPVSPGQVNFCDASAAHCTDVHILGTAQLTSAGTAMFKFHPGIGSHNYKAVFVGTNAYASSFSKTSALAVTGTSTPLTITTTTGKTGNWESYTLTGTVAEVGSPTPIAGSLSFIDTSNGSAVLDTATLGTSIPGWTWVSTQATVVGSGPEYAAAGDFNGDGILDIAVANARDNTVVVLLGRGDGTFAKSATLSLSASPGQIVAADFNGDGILDLAVVNSAYAAGTVTIFLGNGDGTFSSVSSAPNVGGEPVSLAEADFNGDGIPDLAVTSSFTGTVFILLGNGDGTFTTSQMTLASTGCISSLATGDFNGDGKSDLVVTGNCEYDQGNSVIILLGNGDGTFTAGAMPQTGHDVGSVAVADFNGDGIPDLALANSDGTAAMSILLGKGDGTFASSDIGPSVSEHPTAIAWGDFNGDGIVDLALVNTSGNAVEILQGKGDGTFSMAGSAATGNSPFSVVVGDFNGDGRPDIATANYFDSTVTVTLTEPTEIATAATTLTVPGAGQHMVEASFPGSGNYFPSVSSPTLLWGQPPSTATTLAITSGGAPATTVASGSVVTLTASVAIGTSALTTGQVEFCDASATTCADIHLVGSASLTSSGTASFKFIPGPGDHSYKAVLLENALGAASSSPALPLTVSAPPHVAVPTTTTIAQTGSVGNYSLTATVVGTGSTASLTGNVSFLDTSYANSPVATAALGSSTAGLVWQASSSTPSTAGGFPMIAVGDFNGDGVVDFAVVNTYSMTVTILLGNGDGTFKTIIGPTFSTDTTAVVAGDFNGDGRIDLAVSLAGASYNAPGNVAILLGNGDGTFTAVANSPVVGISAGVLAAADFNGDGKIDLLVNDSTDTRILLGNGDGTFTEAPATGLPRTLAVADLNGDGFPDLVVGGTANNVTVYLGNGDGTFRPAGSSISVGTQPNSAVIADFNGDGIPDLAVSGLEYASVTVFLGKGDGTFTPVTGTTNPSINEPGSLVAADVNHDGKLDLIITNWNSYANNAQNPDLTILLGNGDGTFMLGAVDTQLSSTWSIMAADFNGDGTPDLAVGTASGVSVLLTQRSQTATATASGVSPAGPAPHMVDASYPGDSNYSSSTSGTVSLGVQLATPVISLASGTYTSAQTVTITDATPGAIIYYQCWGAISSSGWVPYTGPINVGSEGSVFIEAYASETGYEQSATVSANYLMNLPAAPAPMISPGSGSYAGPQTVTITDSATGALIYYTTDGTIPTLNSAVYSGPIAVSTSETVAAIANGGGYSGSVPAIAQIYIDSAASQFVYTVAGNGEWGYAGDGGLAPAAMLNEPWMTAIDNAGNLYIADTNNSVVRKVDATSGIITTVAGSGMPGYSGDNGPATSAQLGSPRGIALDGSGNLYISDYANQVVREVSAASGIITTVAGSTTATALGDNGPATSAMLTNPLGIVLDSAGNLYIATAARIRVVNASTGTITTYAGNGTSGSSGDNGPATNATLSLPSGMAIDKAGNIYFTDPGAEVVRKITASTQVITTVAGVSFSYNLPIGDGGPATSASLQNPTGVAVDASGNVYIADTYNLEVREVTASNGIISRLIGNKSFCNTLSGDGGPAASSGICFPGGVTVDAAGNLYIAETDTSRVRKITAAATPPTTATSAPVFSVQAGTYASPQTVTISSSTAGAAIYVTLDGTVPVTTGLGYHGPINVTGAVTINALAAAPGYLPSSAATAAYTITAPPSAVIQTIAGGGVNGVIAPSAPATSEVISSPFGVAVDNAGNVYTADPYNCVVWMDSAATGNASIIAGTLGACTDAGNGGPATSASLAGPTHVAIDGSNSIYIADSGSGVIRKVTGNTGMIATYAGGGYPWEGLGDNGPATSAYLSSPEGLALDSASNLYIADQGHSRIRKVTSGGIITTVAGGAINGVLGDGGPATAASLAFPKDVAVDGAGNLFIADLDNGRVRMVAAQTGIISTIAGNGNVGTDGDGALATSAEVYPEGVAVDGAGKVYIANWPASVRTIDPATHLISTFAGSGYVGFSGDGGSATVADLSYPSGVALDKSGNVYIADSYNNRIRELSPPGSTPTPVFSLAAGTYTSAQSLTITDTTQGATIYFTTDGSTPTTASTTYSGSIAISSSETVKAIAVATGHTTSAVATADYVIETATATPTFTPEGGTYTSAQTVTIGDATQGATIYYTTDGSTPSTASTAYSKSITVATSETVKAIAVANGYTTSAVATAAYVINIPATPAPLIGSLSPSYTSAGGAAFTLTITGSGFTSASTVYWGTTALTTRFLSATQLAAQITAADVATAGTTAVAVQTPAPGGGTSNTMQFEVDTAGSTSTPPAFTTVTATVAAGSTASYSVTLPSSVTSASITCLNLPAGATCSYSSTTNTVAIATSSTTPVGTYQITVVFTETVSGAATAGILLPILLLPLVLLKRKLTARGVWSCACLGLILMAATAFSIGCGGGGSSSTTTPPTNPTHQVTSSGSVSLIIH